MFSLDFTFETVYDHGKHESINWNSPFQISECKVKEQRTHTHTRLDGLFCLCEGIPSSRRPRSPSHSGLSICCCAATRSSVQRPPLTPQHPTHHPGVISTSPWCRVERARESERGREREKERDREGARERERERERRKERESYGGREKERSRRMGMVRKMEV